jgi:hypothetical protein
VSEEVPITTDGAIRAWLFAIGFTLVLIGGEMMAEKESVRFWPGLALVVISLPVHLSWVFWQLIKDRLNLRLRGSLNHIATDARWWTATLFVTLVALSVFPYGDFQMAAVWGLAIAAVVCSGFAVVVARRAVVKVGMRPPEAIAAPVKHDELAHLDLLHLFDFGIDQTTVAKLERLIETSTSHQVTHNFDNPDEAHKSRLFYIGWVRQNLDGERLDYYRGVLDAAQFDAERSLREMAPDQRPPGDPLKVREHAISQLQFTKAVQFLGHQKREVEDRLISKRSQLIERRDLRNKGKT